MGELLDYLLDFIFPRLGNKANNTSMLIKPTYQKLGHWMHFANEIRSINLINIHSYFQGYNWNPSIFWRNANLEGKNNLTSSKQYPILHLALYQEAIMNNLIHRAKFKQHWDIAKEVGNVMGSVLKLLEDQELFSMFQYIYLVHIPPDKKRLQARGFHVPEIIAKQIFQKNKTKNSKYIFANILTKTKHTIRQTELNKNLRQTNIQNSFKIDTKKLIDIILPNNENNTDFSNYGSNLNQDKHSSLWVIIDDVTTTGATINEVAKLILENSEINKQKFKLMAFTWLFAS